MPAFTAITLDRFLEPGSSKPNPSSHSFLNSRASKSIPGRELANGGLVFPETHNEVRNIGGNPDRDNGSIYLDPQESLSYAGSTDAEDSCNGECSQNTPMGEFYDAWEELSSGSGCKSSPRVIETEIREMRLCLLAEIEKRKQAEETLKRMQCLWQETKQGLSAAGLILPEIGGVDDQFSENTAEGLCQQVLFTRHVSESVGEEVGKSQMEMDMVARIELKNFEIAKLCDQLRTYQAINHEMCRRNQEAIERTRQKRKLARMRRRQWIWGLVGVSVIVGVGLVASSYLPISESTRSSEAE